MITQGTTPTIRMTMTDATGALIDLSESASIYLSVQDLNENEIDIPFSRFVFNEDKSFEVTLTQEETLSLASGGLKVQIRAKDASGNVIASKIGKIKVGKSIYKEII